MYVRYDPVFRHLTGSETGGPELGPILARDGVLFFETPALPGPLDTLAYDVENNAVVWRQKLPDGCFVASYETDAIDAVVPEIAELPDDAVVEPAIGTKLASGDTLITIRAPYCYEHRFTIRRRTAQDRKNELIAWAANRRWELEMAGAPFRGHRVDTDDRSKVMMMGSVMASQMTPGWSTKWQFKDGGSLVLTGADVAEMSLMAQSYVNGLFDLFGTIKEAIQAGEIISIEEIEVRFNPSAEETQAAA